MTKADVLRDYFSKYGKRPKNEISETKLENYVNELNILSWAGETSKMDELNKMFLDYYGIDRYEWGKYLTDNRYNGIVFYGNDIIAKFDSNDVGTVLKKVIEAPINLSIDVLKDTVKKILPIVLLLMALYFVFLYGSKKLAK